MRARRRGADTASRARAVARQLLAVAMVVTVLLGSGFGLMFSATTLVADSMHLDGGLPPLPELAERTLVYAADGTTIIGTLGIKDRQSVALDDVPPLLVRTIVAVEDATFYENPGIDVVAVVRAALRNADAGAIEQGGSTITQQLVKNRLLQPKRDLRRKLTELSLALQLNRRYSKRRILTEYLNTVYLGNGAYGIQAGVERTFLTVDAPGAAPRAKGLDELTIGEIALLAGLIASPERYNPFTSPEMALQRRADVLARIEEEGIIDPAQARDGAAEPLPTLRATAFDLRPRSFFVDDVQQQLLADPRLGDTAAIRRRRLLRGGLRITTTLDVATQRDAQAAIAQELPDHPPFTAATVVLDNHTGAVRALVGGPDFETSPYDLATHLPGRQAGSTYKMITLAAALELGYSPNDLIDGTSPCSASHPPLPRWDTNNIEPGGGTVTLRDATRLSVNCAFAHLIAAIGPEAVVDMAHRLGVTQPIPAYLSITLGTSNTTPLEMASAASTLANGGMHRDPYMIERVTTAEGHLVLEHEATVARALDADVAACTVDVLRDAVRRGTGTAAAVPDVDVAGKTGTTDDKADAWFVGFTGDFTAAVWMGAPQGHVPMTRVRGVTVYGGTYPARIWRAFADRWTSRLPAPGALADAGPVCTRPGGWVTDFGRGAPRWTPPPGAGEHEESTTAPAEAGASEAGSSR